MLPAREGATAKRIAVLVRERQGEALRVAVGQTLKSGRVEVFVLDRKVAGTPDQVMHIEVLRELGMRIATNCADNVDFELLPNADLARQIAECDLILPY